MADMEDLDFGPTYNLSLDEAALKQNTTRFQIGSWNPK